MGLSVVRITLAIKIKHTQLALFYDIRRRHTMFIVPDSAQISVWTKEVVSSS